VTTILTVYQFISRFIHTYGTGYHRAEAAAVDHYVSSKTKNISIPTSAYGHREIDQWLFVTRPHVPAGKKSKGSPYSITEHRVPELIPVLGSQPVGNASHKPGCRLLLLTTRPAVTPATLKRAATNFAAWWTKAQWVRAVCLRLLPDSTVTAI